MDMETFKVFGIDNDGRAEDAQGNPYELDIDVQVGDEPNTIGQKMVDHFGVHFKRIIVSLADFTATQMCKVPQRES